MYAYPLMSTARTIATPLFALLLASNGHLKAQETYVVVPVSLNAPIIRATLPFREPFYVAAVGVPNVTAAKVHYRLASDPAASGTALAVCSGEKSDSVSSWSGPALGDTIFFNVPELLPNRRYLFCVETTSRPSAQDVQSLRAVAGEILNRKLIEVQKRIEAEHLGEPAQFSADDIKTLKIELVREVSKSTGRKLITHDSLSLFDTTSAALYTSIEVDFIRLFELQQERRDNIETIEGFSRALQELIDLQENAAFRQFIQFIDTNDAVFPGSTPEATRSAAETARFLYAPPPGAIAAVAGGVMRVGREGIVPVQQKRLPDVWAAADITVRQINMDTLAKKITGLRSAISSVRSSRELSRKVGWSVPSAARLDSTLELASQQIHLLRNSFARLSDALSQRTSVIEASVSDITTRAERSVSLQGTSILNFQTRASSSINADIGLAYAPVMDEVVPYFGANFYLGAINKRVPLSYAGTFRDRFSLTLGLTASSVSKANDRDNLFGSFALLLGGGYRIADPIRVTAGAMALRQVSQNGFDTDKDVVFTPFFSLSLDYDVRSVLGKITDKLF